MDTKRLVEKFYIMVLLDCAKGALGLDGAVRAQQRSVDTVKIGKNFLVESGQSFIQTDGTVTNPFGALATFCNQHGSLFGRYFFTAPVC